MRVLEHETNRFGGVEIAAEALPDDSDRFTEQLDRSLEAWRDEGHSLVWLQVPIVKAGLIPIAVDTGFTFHHSGDDYLMLVLRLQDGAFVPNYATHYIGVGGAVINDRDELLVVCEKHRRSSRPYYKLPGGALHPEEHVHDGVIREVLEETGVRTRFEALACFRHWHGYRYGKSDIYFICRLKPINEDITPDPDEIEECLWMPVKEYFESDLVGDFNKKIVRAAMQGSTMVTSTVEGYSRPDTHEIFMPQGLDDA